MNFGIIKVWVLVVVALAIFARETEGQRGRWAAVARARGRGFNRGRGNQAPQTPANGNIQNQDSRSRATAQDRLRQRLEWQRKQREERQNRRLQRLRGRNNNGFRGRSRPDPRTTEAPATTPIPVPEVPKETTTPSPPELLVIGAGDQGPWGGFGGEPLGGALLGEAGVDTFNPGEPLTGPLTETLVGTSDIINPGQPIGSPIIPGAPVPNMGEPIGVVGGIPANQVEPNNPGVPLGSGTPIQPGVPIGGGTPIQPGVPVGGGTPIEQGVPVGGGTPLGGTPVGAEGGADWVDTTLGAGKAAVLQEVNLSDFLSPAELAANNAPQNEAIKTGIQTVSGEFLPKVEQADQSRPLPPSTAAPTQQQPLSGGLLGIMSGISNKIRPGR